MTPKLYGNPPMFLAGIVKRDGDAVSIHSNITLRNLQVGAVRQGEPVRLIGQLVYTNICDA